MNLPEMKVLPKKSKMKMFFKELIVNALLSLKTQTTIKVRLDLNI
jgi:hypothetical protein